MANTHVNAIVVGAGAGGGVVSKELAIHGLSVVLVRRKRGFSRFLDPQPDLRLQAGDVLYVEGETEAGLPGDGSGDLTPDEQREIRERLKGMGYLG